jgi:CRP-like cAMP-binding protein
MDYAAYGTEMSVRAGGRLLVDGPFAQALVLIVDGRGRVRCAGETVAQLGPGDRFGELAPHLGAYAPATVTAVTDLTLVAFSSRQIKLMGRHDPVAAAELLGGGDLSNVLPPPSALRLVPAA